MVCLRNKQGPEKLLLNYLVSEQRQCYQFPWFQTFAVFCMLYVFWVIPQHQNLVILHLPAYEDGTDRVFQNIGI